MGYRGDRVRVLVIPGLHDSGPTHWQTWLQAHFRGALRVQQDDWASADLDRWSQRIETTLAAHPGVRWVAVAHSFGCLALVRHLAQSARGDAGIQAALMVAPADPEKFSVGARLPQGDLGIPSVLMGSETDPWMRIDSARAWARLWNAQFINLGEAGHVNAEAGYGPLPPAKTVAQLLIHQVERVRRIDRAHPLEFSFSI